MGTAGAWSRCLCGVMVGVGRTVMDDPRAIEEMFGATRAGHCVCGISHVHSSIHLMIDLPDELLEIPWR